ncbi:MAG: hypothetical protein ACRENS_11205 [Candidatus Eiseniibacteriota bacterium]
MKRFAPLHGLLAIALLAALVASGCSRKLATDPGITMPEGVFSPNSQLVMSTDFGNPVEVWHGTGGGGQAYDSTYNAYLRTPGITIGMLFDGTNSSGFELMRRQSSGSYADIKDYLLTPLDRWLSSHWESYVFFDGSTSSYSPPTYLGRGKVAGVITPSSPLTNEAMLSSAPVDTVSYIGTLFPADTLVKMEWTRVPGAVRYWLEIFGFRNDVRTVDELFPIGAKTPLAIGKVHNYFVGFVEAPATSYRLGDPGATVLTYQALLRNNTYRVRVAAVDAAGRLLAITSGAQEVRQRDNNYYHFSLSAVLITL